MVRSIFRITRKLAPWAAAAAAALVAYHLVVNQLVDRWDESAPRDPETGILVGAESLDLGSENAGAAVLLVHGFIGGSNNFGDLPQRLADEGYRVRAILLPGHGTSPRDFAATPVNAFIPSVLEELRALKATHQQVFLAGHSMGGALSTLAATIEDVDGLVLAAPYFGVTYQWYYILPAETWTTLTSPFVRWVYKGDGFVRVKRREAVDEILSYRWVPAQGSRALVKLGKLASDPLVLDLVTCPVLHLHGRDDLAAAPERARAAFDAMASTDKEFVWLEESDHHIFWDYEREEVLQRIVDFLNDHRIPQD